MTWIKNANTALAQAQTVDFPIEGYTLSVKWMQDLTESELAELKQLLDNAYSDRSMWPYFCMNIEKSAHVIVFMLRDSHGAMVATRSVGEVVWAYDHWREVSSGLGLSAPVAGGAYTVKTSLRRKGLGKALYSISNIWLENVAQVPVIFASTSSYKGLPMYFAQGAVFKECAAKRLASHLGISISAAYKNPHEWERLPDGYAQEYVWILDDAIAPVLAEHGYTLRKDAA